MGGYRKGFRWRCSPLGPILVALILTGQARFSGADQSTDRARRLAEEARREYILGHWPDAIRAFEEAYRLTGDPALLFNLGQAHRMAGHTADALRFYKIYLAEAPNALGFAPE